jgi:hypothetical protein
MLHPNKIELITDDKCYFSDNYYNYISMSVRPTTLLCPQQRRHIQLFRFLSDDVGCTGRPKHSSGLSGNGRVNASICQLRRLRWCTCKSGRQQLSCTTITIKRFRADYAHLPTIGFI